MVLDHTAPSTSIGTSWTTSYIHIYIQKINGYGYIWENPSKLTQKNLRCFLHANDPASMLQRKSSLDGWGSPNQRLQPWWRKVQWYPPCSSESGRKATGHHSFLTNPGIMGSMFFDTSEENESGDHGAPRMFFLMALWVTIFVTRKSRFPGLKCPQGLCFACMFWRFSLNRSALLRPKELKKCCYIAESLSDSNVDLLPFWSFSVIPSTGWRTEINSWWCYSPANRESWNHEFHDPWWIHWRLRLPNWCLGGADSPGVCDRGSHRFVFRSYYKSSVFHRRSWVWRPFRWVRGS